MEFWSIKDAQALKLTHDYEKRKLQFTLAAFSAQDRWECKLSKDF